MGRTFLTGGQVKDGSVQKVDLDTTTTGQAVITKVIAGTNISISSTGVDVGTGDVTVNLGGTVASDISSLQSSISGKADSSSLATVATSGSYTDLSNKPSLFDGAYSSLTGAPALTNVATSGSYTDLSNKPALFSGSYTDLTNKPTVPASIDDLSDVTITSPSTDQILKYNGSAWVNGTAPSGSSFSGSYTDLTNKPSLFDGAYSSLTGAPSLATVATSGSYTDLTDKPTVPAALDDLSDVTITSASKGQFIVHNGTSFINSNTIESSAAAVKPLIVKGATSQSANLFEVQNSASTALFSVNSNGTVAQMTAGSGSSAYFQVSANFVWVRLGRAYQQFGSYTGAYIAAGDDGVAFTIRMGAAADAESMRVEGKTAGSTAAPRVGFGETTLGAGAAQVNIKTPDATRKGLIVKGAASQTANLFEAQNSTGTALVAIRSDGTETITTSGSNLGLAITHNTTGQSCLGLTHTLAGTGTQYYAAFYNATPALVGSITTNGSSTTYATTSDYRLKENVVPMAGGLSRLIQLPVYRFNYKERPQETVDGCLAHEVSGVVPEAVIGEKDAVDSSGMMMPQAVDYSKLVPLLVAAIKELKQKNDELESRLATLENN